MDFTPDHHLHLLGPRSSRTSRQDERNERKNEKEGVVNRHQGGR